MKSDWEPMQHIVKVLKQQRKTWTLLLKSKVVQSNQRLVNKQLFLRCDIRLTGFFSIFAPALLSSFFPTGFDSGEVLRAKMPLATRAASSATPARLLV